MSPTVVLLLAFLIGIVSGLRSLTPSAVVAWAAHGGVVRLSGTVLAFMGNKWTAIVLTVLALAELVSDKLPSTPNRTAPPGLIARFVLGGLAGASLEVAGHQALYVGAILGAAGGVLGAFLGYQVRKRAALQFPPIVVAIAEDVAAIVVAVVIALRF
jgi:uncharacterized membrane protein